MKYRIILNPGVPYITADVKTDVKYDLVQELKTKLYINSETAFKMVNKLLTNEIVTEDYDLVHIFKNCALKEYITVSEIGAEKDRYTELQEHKLKMAQDFYENLSVLEKSYVDLLIRQNIPHC